MRLARPALVGLAIVVTSCQPVSSPVTRAPPPDDATSPLHETSPTTGRGREMPSPGDSCQGHRVTSFCVDGGTLLACVDGRFVKHHCAVCSQTFDDAHSSQHQMMTGGCLPTGVGAEGASCARPSRDCDGRTLVVCDGQTYHRTECRGPSGCTIDRGVHCEGLPRLGEPCDEEDRKVCAADGTSLLACQGGKLVMNRACGGPGGCVIQGSRFTCDSSQAAAGDACVKGGACTRDGRSLLLCRDGRYQLAMQCLGSAGGCIHTPSDTVQCADPFVGEAGKPCFNPACTPDGKSLLRCESGAFTLDRRCPKGCGLAASGEPACRPD